MDTATGMATTTNGGGRTTARTRNWDPIDACIGVQGPFGYVQGSACI